MPNAEIPICRDIPNPFLKKPWQRCSVAAGRYLCEFKAAYPWVYNYIISFWANSSLYPQSETHSERSSPVHARDFLYLLLKMQLSASACGMTTRHGLNSLQERPWRRCCRCVDLSVSFVRQLPQKRRHCRKSIPPCDLRLGLPVLQR